MPAANVVSASISSWDGCLSPRLRTNYPLWSFEPEQNRHSRKVFFGEGLRDRRIGGAWGAGAEPLKKVSRHRRARVWTRINVVPASIAFGSSAHFEFQEVF